MKLSSLLLKELEQESLSTRKLLECLPDNNEDWQPHAKSFPLYRMATHVAELPMFLPFILKDDSLDYMTLNSARLVCNSRQEIIALMDRYLDEAKPLFENVTDEELMQTWLFTMGERVISKSSRYEAIRSWVINHQVHHRGQLSVYLRLLDIPIPGMYGPSADDKLAREQAAAIK